MCAGPKIEDSPGAGATIHITFVYAISWCDGTAPGDAAARTSQLQNALGQFECEDVSPIPCTSRNSEASVYTVDEYRLVGGRSTPDAVLASAHKVEYVILIDSV